METIKATVNKILFSNEETGYKVLSTKTNQGKLTITGEFGPEIISNTVAFFHGDYKSNPKYGHQFRARSYNIEHNAHELSSISLFLDTIAENVGTERSSAIIDYFGIETINIIEHNPERLLEVPGVGQVTANSITTAWKSNRQQWLDSQIIFSLRAFLMSLGLRERRIKKVLSFFDGREFSAEDVIRNNPYTLVELDGFGFSIVDYIAQKLGLSQDSSDRFSAFILYVIETLCPSQGHLFLTFSEIQNSINQFCLENNTKFLGKKIDLNDIDVHVTQLVKDKKLIFEDGNVYSTHNFKYEQTAARLLSKIISEPSDMIFLNQDKVTKHIEIFEHENGIQLSNEQKTALYYFAIHKVFVISGLPGTGKTLICKAVIELALKMNLKLTCLTPTGISAKKLSQTINYPSYTIHRRLQYRGNEWVYNENNPFETDLILIDESSMLDQEVLYRLLSAVKKRVHIIFIGDHNQLPSVGAGNVLKELIDCGNIPTIKLDKIFRQNEASDIIAASHKIIKGDTDLSLFKDDPKSDIVFIRTQKPSEIEEIVKELAKKLKDEKKLFQIIAARNDGPCGVNPLNTILQASLNPHKDELKEINLKNFVIRCGDRVIIKKNDYEHDIYNGDIGKVISMSGGNIVLAIDERQVELTIDEASEILKLAYAQTVHSVQGQEYPTIILIFINQYGRLIYRNLLYTALTRAKKKVIVIGHGSAIEKAILNANVTKRNTLLGQRITKCLQNEKNPSLLELQPQQQTFQIVTN